MDKAQSMRFDACLPQSWWEFSVLHAVHVYNRTPLRRLKWQTPFEALNGTVPDIEHLRILGCGAYVYLPEEIRLNKLAPKSELIVYLGVANGIKGYKFMRLTNNTIFTGATALFDESMFPKCLDQKRQTFTCIGQDTIPRLEDNLSPPTPQEDEVDDFTIPHTPPYPRTRRHDEPNNDHHSAPSTRSPSPVAAPETESELPGTSSELPVTRQSKRQHRSVYRPDNVYEERRNPTEQFRDIERMRYWKKTIGEQSNRSRTVSHREQEQVPISSSSQNPDTHSDSPPLSDTEADGLLAKLCREGGVELMSYLLVKAVPSHELLPVESNPREWTLKDIFKLPQGEQEEWKTACREELEALHKRNVFELVDCPPGCKVIKNRWVFDFKTDGRKKARLVAKGFSQVEGIDFDQIFSPVVRFETVRLVLALAALEGWHITGVDVKSSYLYGKLDEEIYMEQPEGFKVRGNEHKVLRLLRAIYGLKQAGLVWWRALNEFMKLLRYKRLSSDAGIFIFKDFEGNSVVIIVYVDDALFCGKNKAPVAKLKADFMKQWECRDLGDTKEFLRMCIQRKAGKIYIDQTAYLSTLR